MRSTRLWMLAAILAMPVLAAEPGGFRFVEVEPGSLQLLEGNAPVYTYNYGMKMMPGAPEDRKRCCYTHPVWTPGGVVVTDDFPEDHYHHRGIGWMWPRVIIDGKQHDLWMLRGIRHEFGEWKTKQAGRDKATLAVENRWVTGKGTVMREQVEIVAHPAKQGSRVLEYTLRYDPQVPLAIGGELTEDKGYGGFNIRFAPRKNTTLQTPAGARQPDSNMQRYPWAELSGDYEGGKAATVRFDIDPGNPDYPNGWCLRNYGFLGVNYPGVEPVKLTPGKPLVMRYQVTVRDGR
jgi:hypothetical protein